MKKLYIKEPKRMSDGLPGLIILEFKAQILSKFFDDYCDLDELNRALIRFFDRMDIAYHPQLGKMAEKLTKVFIEHRKLNKRIFKLEQEIPKIA